MQVTNEVRTEVQNKIISCYERAEKHYDRPFNPPVILFNKRGTTAGTANGSTNTLNFNAVLLMENQEDFIERTVTHEVAHLIDYIVNPHNHIGRLRNGRRMKRNIHGYDFKFIMERVLGADDSTRCHGYDVTNARVTKRGQAKHEWKCNVCSATMELGPKRHPKMVSDNQMYRPRGRGCGFHHTYSYVGVVGQAPDRFASQTAVPTKPKHPTMSNKDRARGIYRNTMSRSAFISTCIAQGIKKTTAGTYYQNFKSGAWA